MPVLGFFPCCFCVPLIWLVMLAGVVFWIWTLVEVVTKEPEEDKDRLMWLLIVLLANQIGALIYFFVRRPQRIQKYGR